MRRSNGLARLPLPSIDRRGLRVRWFDLWHDELDRAVRELPETVTCPHELLRLLMRNPSPMQKRTALVTADNDPVAVLGLRRRKRFWEPVWGGAVNERFTLAAHEGYVVPALAATGANVWITTREAPTRVGFLRSVQVLPIFAIALDTNYEAHWRSSSHWDSIRRARRRTVGFTFEVDGAESASWTIRSWAMKWRAHEAESDMLLAAAYYKERGLYRSFILRDGPRTVAGCTFIVHEKELQAQINHYDPAYAQRAVATRLDDLVFEWAAREGYSKIDYGCSYSDDSYKRRWAPRAGTAWLYNVAPPHIHLVRATVHAARAVANVARATLRSASRKST